MVSFVGFGQLDWIQIANEKRIAFVLGGEFSWQSAGFTPR